jgi:hypothetical protein
MNVMFFAVEVTTCLHVLMRIDIELEQYRDGSNIWVFYLYIFLISWGGVRLSQVGTWATDWPVVPVPVDRWWVRSSQWNENWQGKPKYSERTGPSTTLSTTNLTIPVVGSSPGRRCLESRRLTAWAMARPNIWVCPHRRKGIHNCLDKLHLPKLTAIYSDIM